MNCPKCSRPLPVDGVLMVDDQSFDVYSCPECLMIVEFGGESMELPLSFAVGVDGVLFDPGDPDGRLSI